MLTSIITKELLKKIYKYKYLILQITAITLMLYNSFKPIKEKPIQKLPKWNYDGNTRDSTKKRNLPTNFSQDSLRPSDREIERYIDKYGD